MNDVIVYGVVGILACLALFLLFCVVVVIINMIAHGIDVDDETKMMK